jgi:DNA helicase-2/ATP-dependent DNA helicase PcrA
MHDATPQARTFPVSRPVSAGPPWAFAQPVPVVLPDDLNDQQRKAIAHLHGPLLVLAPVGTGKTTVIAHRAAHAIRSGIEPAHVLCLSFTNRAAREMRDRILTLLGNRASEVTVRTFHGFCTQVLRHEADALGIPADFTICDEEDAREILVDLARRQGAAPDAAGQLGDVLPRLVERMKLSLLDCDPGHDANALLGALAEEADAAVRAALLRLDPDRLLADYDAALAGSGSLGFSDLILRTNRLFTDHPDRLARWQTLHPWVQVDEVQDTNLHEYHILARLAEASRNLAFFGDIDQTIYEWRGSDPFRTLAEFKRRFAPVREIALTKNYRSSRVLLQACEAFLRTHPHAVTKALVGESEDTGRRVVVHAEPTLSDEARWIAATIADVARQGISKRQIAILVRANHTAVELSRVLAAEQVDHFLVDKVRFFRQAEVKDALAHVRFLLNPYDAHSLLRMLRRPPSSTTLTHAAVRSLPPEVGLRLVDFADPLTAEYMDPFGLLLRCYAEGRVVVFDVESTGLDVTRDDVVELAALRVGTHGATDEFRALLRTSRPLEESARIHGITADVLARDGRDPAEVFDEFLAFLDGCVVVGHNVGYDVNIVRSQLRRLGRRWPDSAVPFDTLDLCRRFFRLPSYTLANVCRELRLASAPTHRAADDVKTTWHLLQRLIVPLLTTRPQRERFVAEYAPAFAGLNESLRRWRTLLDVDRPVFLLEKMLDESGLRDYWGRQENGKKRLANLMELARLFGIYDDGTLAPREAMLNVVHLAALGNEVDRYVEGEERVYLLTVHQAKGLEFDTVFIAGATDRQFPSSRSEKEGRLDEELRLFYVAMTRARRRLFISHHLRDDRDKPQQPSRFLASIPGHLLHLPASASNSSSTAGKGT